MQEVLEKILEILNAQDARIKALEAELEVCGVDIGDVVGVLHEKINGERFDGFSARHKSKFEPYMSIMDKLEGGDSFRTIYDKHNEFSDQENYDEDVYVDSVLASIIETINGLRAVVPPEVQPALEAAEAAVQEAVITNDQAEGVQPEIIDEAETKDLADEVWDEDALMKEHLEGRQFYR